MRPEHACRHQSASLRRAWPWLPALLLFILALWPLVGCTQATPAPITEPTEALTYGWTADEIARIASLWIGSLKELPADPGNGVGDNPAAANLGQALFFDARLSANGAVSCATCHQPDNYFTDGKQLPEGMGLGPRHTPTIVGIAYSPWFYWDGRRDSQWAQALAPLEQGVEHGGTRTQYALFIAENPDYRAQYEAIFGPLPDLSGIPAVASPRGTATEQAAWAALAPEQQDVVNQIFANIGKSLAAYERLILPGPAPFDAYAAALLNGDETAMEAALNTEAEEGLKLFVGRANCIQCHNGPLFTNNDFHNIGLQTDFEAGIDQGRAVGVQQALDDPFNCLGAFSDAAPERCAELRFVKTMGTELIGAFKVPTLRNVAATAPYMHDGRFSSLPAVLAHYNAAPLPLVGHSDLLPLGLTGDELGQLAAFLESLTGPLDVDPGLLSAGFQE